MPRVSKRVRCCVFTFNYGKDGQPGHPGEEHFAGLVTVEGPIRYICYGEEEAPTTGQKHLQGYVEFTKAFSYQRIKELMRLGNTIHLEERAGTQAQAIGYCMGGPEWGKPINEVFKFWGQKASQGTVRCPCCGYIDVVAIGEEARLMYDSLDGSGVELPFMSEWDWVVEAAARGVDPWGGEKTP